MGRRKPFVDKKKSTTYNVIYREAAQEDETAEEREWVEKEKGVGVGRPDMDLLEERHHQESLQGRRYPPGHPLSWLEEEEGQEALSEERRKQNLDLGFPDDGYDYLKHLRVLGKGKGEGLSSAEGPSAAAAANPPAPGPGVFVPASFEVPEVDRKVYDAHALSLNAARQKQAHDDEFSREVTAFTREARRLRQIREQELEEMQKYVSNFENVEDDAAASQGLGDLLDDFVLSATEAPTAACQDDEPGMVEADHPASNAGSSKPHASSGSSNVPRAYPTAAPSGLAEVDSDGELPDDGRFADAAEEEDEEDDDELTEVSSVNDAGSLGSELGSGDATLRPSHARGPAETASVASTWRPERTDRNPNLSFIDERFEQLALDYDSDQIGDLEEDPGEAQGCVDLGTWGNVLDQFLASFATADHAHESGARYHTLAEESPADAARHKAELDSDEEDTAPKAGNSYLLEQRQPDHWDCESVLTARTNLDNHPGQIGSGPGRPRSQKLPSAAALDGKMQRNQAAQQEAVDLPEARAKAREMEPRRKDESTEEKKHRKAVVKDAKRAARATKKELRVKYKHDHCLNQKAAAGNLLSPAIAM